MRLHGILKGFGSTPETPGGKCVTCRPVKGFGSIPTLGNEAFTLELVADNGNRVRTNVLANEYYLPGVGVTQAQANAAAQAYFRAIGEAQLNRRSVSSEALNGADIMVFSGTPVVHTVKAAETLYRGGLWLFPPLDLTDRWSVNYAPSDRPLPPYRPYEHARFGYSPVGELLTGTPHCWCDGPSSLVSGYDPARGPATNRWFFWWHPTGGVRAIVAPISTASGEFSEAWLAAAGQRVDGDFFSGNTLPGQPRSFSAAFTFQNKPVLASELDGVITVLYQYRRLTFSGSNPVLFSTEAVCWPLSGYGTDVLYLKDSDRCKVFVRLYREAYSTEYVYATLPLEVGRLVTAGFDSNRLLVWAMSKASRRGAVEQLVIRSTPYTSWPTRTVEEAGLATGLSGGSIGDALVGTLQYDLGVQSTGLSGGELFGSAGYFDTLAYDLGVQSTGLTGGELEDTYVLITSLQYDLSAQTTGLSSGELVETTSNKTTTTPAESSTQSGTLSWGRNTYARLPVVVVAEYPPEEALQHSPWARYTFGVPVQTVEGRTTYNLNSNTLIEWDVMPASITSPPVVPKFLTHDDVELTWFGGELSLVWTADFYETSRAWFRVHHPTANGVLVSPWYTFAYRQVPDETVTHLGAVSESWL